MRDWLRFLNEIRAAKLAGWNMTEDYDVRPVIIQQAFQQGYRAYQVEENRVEYVRVRGKCWDALKKVITEQTVAKSPMVSKRTRVYDSFDSISYCCEMTEWKLKESVVDQILKPLKREFPYKESREAWVFEGQTSRQEALEFSKRLDSVMNRHATEAFRCGAAKIEECLTEQIGAIREKMRHQLKDMTCPKEGLASMLKTLKPILSTGKGEVSVRMGNLGSVKERTWGGFYNWTKSLFGLEDKSMVTVTKYRIKYQEVLSHMENEFRELFQPEFPETPASSPVLLWTRQTLTETERTFMSSVNTYLAEIDALVKEGDEATQSLKKNGAGKSSHRLLASASKTVDLLEEAFAEAHALNQELENDPFYHV